MPTQRQAGGTTKPQQPPPALPLGTANRLGPVWPQQQALARVDQVGWARGTQANLLWVRGSDPARISIIVFNTHPSAQVEHKHLLGPRLDPAVP